MTAPRHSQHQGSILLLSLIFLGIFVAVGAALLGYITDSLTAERTSVASAQALALAEGAVDEAISQLNQNLSYTGETNTPLGAGTFSSTVTAVDASTKQISVTASVPNSAKPIAVKTLTATITISNDVVSFHYGIQAGQGGFSLYNSSSITGNVYAGGPVIGAGGNMIYGDVVSSGANGLVYGIHATSSIFAHTIGNAAAATIVDKDAYYVSKTNTTVKGVSNPNSADQPDAALPIADAQIAEWESQAVAGGTINSCDANGNYTVSSSISLGPVKIACNLVVKSSAGVLKVTGPIWVAGNMTTQTGPTIKIDPALGSQNVPIIADNPSDQTGSGTISVGQSTVFLGSGAPNSFVFLISQNTSAETGGSNVAVAMSQGASALVAYAAHGLLTLSQSVSVKQATGYKISLSQSANVTYDTGLPNTVFASGPGGSWAMATGTYAIVK